MSQDVEEARKSWNRYWSQVAWIGWFADFYRKQFLSRPMSRMIEKYFPPNGVFLEAGCGSATDTFFYNKKERTFIGMDISEEALRIASRQKNIDEVRMGDICDMPFPHSHFDGIWNLGVMEHFSPAAMKSAFSEMRRTLKPGGHLILLWPSVWNLVNMLFWWLFPKMPSLLRSQEQGRAILIQNQFQPCEEKTTIMGDIILVGRKI